MSQLLFLNLRNFGRSIDRATGSPLARLTAVGVVLALPLAALLLGVVSDKAGTNDASGFSSAFVSSLIFAFGMSFLFTYVTTLSWNIEERMLSIYRLSPVASGRWQIALLGPVVLGSLWIAWTGAVPFLRIVALNDHVGLAGRGLACAAMLACPFLGASTGLASALVARRSVSLVPERFAGAARLAAVLGVVGTVGWLTFAGWTASISFVSEGDRFMTINHSAALIGLVALAVAAGGTVFALTAARNVPYATVGSGAHRWLRGAALHRSPLAVRPAVLGLTWVRGAGSSALLSLAVVLCGLGFVRADHRWLSYLGLFITAAGLVGFAGGNVALRSFVAMSPRGGRRWFWTNGFGALLTWVAVALPWTVVMLALGEQDIVVFALLCTALGAVALILGCAFARAYESSLGAEAAQFVSYGVCLAAALAVTQTGLLDRYSTAIVALAAVVVVVSAVGSYARIAGTDRSGVC